VSGVHFAEKDGERGGVDAGVIAIGAGGVFGISETFFVRCAAFCERIAPGGFARGIATCFFPRSTEQTERLGIAIPGIVKPGENAMASEVAPVCASA
jgi:hypothetical protein